MRERSRYVTKRQMRKQFTLRDKAPNARTVHAK